MCLLLRLRLFNHRVYFYYCSICPRILVINFLSCFYHTEELRNVKFVSEKWDPRPETRDPTHRWDPRPETRDHKSGTRVPRSGTQLIGGTRDPKGGTWNSRPGTLRVNFQNAFAVFSETLRKSMSILYIYIYFVCFSLPYHTAYTLLIFYHLKHYRSAHFQKLY